MGKVLVGIITLIFIVIVVIWGVNSCDGDSKGVNEIGDFKEILKLSVLSIDYEDVYVIDGYIGTDDNPESRKLVYTVRAKGEYKYDLEKVYDYIDTVSGKRTIVLPTCSFEIALPAPPSLEYVQKDKKFLNPKDVSHEDEQKYRSQLRDSINSRLNNKIYKREAFKHAKHILEAFFKNLGDSIVVKESESM